MKKLLLTVPLLLLAACDKPDPSTRPATRVMTLTSQTGPTAPTVSLPLTGSTIVCTVPSMTTPGRYVIVPPVTTLRINGESAEFGERDLKPGDTVEVSTACPTLSAVPEPVPAPAPAPAPTPAPITYNGPLTITKGGTYSGNWESTGTMPVITIKTAEPVVIENSRIRGGGRLITGFGYDLTVRNVRGDALTPNLAGSSATRVVVGEEIRNLRVEDSSFTGGGIYVRSFKGTGEQGIRILRNTFRNIDGRQSDGKGGYNGKTNIMQAVQLNAVNRIENAEIAWNQIINEPGKSAVEDNINLYVSSGTPEKPILIHDNYIQGAYPANPASTSYSGGGIMLGDGKVTDPALNGYARASDNQVVSTTNYGLAIAGGVGNELLRNRAVSSGRLPDGSRLPAQNVGMYVWDISGAGALTPPTFGKHRVEGNALGWTKVGTDGKTSTNPMWLPNLTLNGGAGSGNTSLGTVTPEMEKAEFAAWQKKLKAAGMSIGAR
ncbi:hypothetical protein [Deinococcus apachensis]|uniref:hypothetical protein n=1 Tax=Deinococcus apachensis TaxID=309886 RepID=UPI0003A71987|nr:hypothetical protein [Deinococcus apachensis]